VAAASKLNEAERDLKAARTALEEARDGQRPIAERLAEAGSDEERWQLIDEQSAPKEREAVTVADLREARVLVLDAEDGVIVARSALEQLQQSSTAATAMANRANNRRQKAINEVVRRECARLMQAAERLTRELADARLSLRFVSANLVDGMGDERRQIYRLGISGRCSRRNSASRPSLARLWRRGGLLRRRLRETLPRPSRPEILNPGPSPGSPSDEWASSAWRFPGSRGGGFFQTIENYHERMTTKRHQMDAVRTASNGGLSGKIFASSWNSTTIPPWWFSDGHLDPDGRRLRRKMIPWQRKAQGALRGNGRIPSSGAFNQVARYQPKCCFGAQMFKAIAIMALGTVLALPPVVSVAQTGYGTRPNSHPRSSFERSWNKGNESKDRARQSAEWVRHHHRNPF
jgi:hypothetical protein